MDDRRGMAGVVAAVALAAGVLGGCQQTAKVNYAGARQYPEGRLQTRAVDVQVFRNGTRVELTNTSAETIGGGVMWLNRFYSAEMPELAPGESVTMPLSSFRNEFGERFRAGGFFASRDPDFVVLAQVERGEELVGLVVVQNRIK